MIPLVLLSRMMCGERLLVPRISELFKKREIHYAKISDHETTSVLASNVLCPLEFYELMHKLLEYSKLEILEDAFHLTTLEQPKIKTIALAT
jgi:hypothetical protein